MDTKKYFHEIIFTLVDRFGNCYDSEGGLYEFSISCYDDHLFRGGLTLAKGVSALRQVLLDCEFVLGRDRWISEVWADYGWLDNGIENNSGLISLDLISSKITRK